MSLFGSIVKAVVNFAVNLVTKPAETIQKVVKAVENFVSHAIDVISAAQNTSSGGSHSSDSKTKDDKHDDGPRGSDQARSKSHVNGSRASSPRDLGGDLQQQSELPDLLLEARAKSLFGDPSLLGYTDKPQPEGLLLLQLKSMAYNNRLAQEMLIALRIEGISSFYAPDRLKPERWLQSFARYGWEQRETAEARKILDIWVKEVGFVTTRLTSNQQRLTSEVMSIGMNSALLTPQAQTTLEDNAFQQVEALGMTNMPDAVKALKLNQANGLYPDELEYEQKLLEQVFGYKLELWSGFSEDQKRQELQRLAASNVATTQYFNTLNGSAANDSLGLSIFHKYFAENGSVTVYLGAENTWTPEDIPTHPDNAAIGLTPLEGENTHGIFLGSNVTTGTITHEFFHQLDRAVGSCAPDCLSMVGAGQRLSDYVNITFQDQVKLIYDADHVYGGSVVQGHVGTFTAPGSQGEMFADLGMTLVLDGAGEKVYVLLPVFKDGKQVFDENGKPEMAYQLQTVGWGNSTKVSDTKAYLESLLSDLQP